MSPRDGGAHYEGTHGADPPTMEIKVPAPPEQTSLDGDGRIYLVIPQYIPVDVDLEGKVRRISGFTIVQTKCF